MVVLSLEGWREWKGLGGRAAQLGTGQRSGFFSSSRRLLPTAISMALPGSWFFQNLWSLPMPNARCELAVSFPR